MPDIDFQRIELNLIPKQGDEPVVFYASQYETTRPFIADLFWGDTEFTPGDDCWAEIDIRKNDDNLVVITDDVAIDNNEVSVILPVQAVTCVGKNLGQVKIYAGEDQLIAALNFILEVQHDPLAGGVTSDTAIDNLESQIAAIVPEVIGEDYYDKTEVDALLADKADVSDLPDMSNYYTKSEVDYELRSYKTWSDTREYLEDNYYDQDEINRALDSIFPTLTASGTIATFRTALSKPLVSVTTEEGATAVTRCGKNMFSYNDLPLYSGYFDGTNFNGTPLDEVDIETVESWRWCYYLLPVSGKSGITLSGFDTVSGVMAVWLFDLSDFSNFQNAFGGNEKNGTHVIPNNAKYLVVPMVDVLSRRTNYPNAQAEYGSIATDFEAYNAETVPVADATTLETLVGENNVYADSGDVTVQYKYMSI